MGYLLALSSLKFPLGFKIYLNVIPLLLGLYHLISRKSSHLKFFWPIILMLFLNLIPLIIAEQYKGVLRLVQVFLMINFAYFICEIWKNQDAEKFSTFTTWLAAGLMILEIIFIGPDGIKNYFGMQIPRYRGLLGESNFSAIILVFNSLLLWELKKKGHFFLNLFLLLLLASRTGALMLIFYFSFKYLYDHKKYFKGYLGFFFVISFLTPFIIYICNLILPIEFIVYIEKLSNGRFFLWYPYVVMGFKNVLGVGYFQGIHHYEFYLKPILTFVDSIRGHQLNEQHSIYIQVFSEFGFICYALFCYQVFLIIKKIYNSKIIVTFTTLMFGYLLLNGLTEYLLYLTIGIGFSSGEMTFQKREWLR